MPRLPRELTDMIIDFLHNDKHSLAACSLACWDFRPASLVHLMERIRLHEEARIQEFPAFLDSSPCIAPLIRSLDILDHPTWPLERMQRLEALPNLRSLSFAETNIDTHLVGFVQHWCTQITTLSLQDSNCLSFHNMANLLVELTSLERLVLDGLSWSYSGPSPLSRITSDLCVVIIRHCFLAAPIRWFILHERLLPLHTLSLSTIVPNELPDIGNFLSWLGGSLRHLELKFEQSFEQFNEGLFS